VFCDVLCVFCTGHFVMVPINLSLRTLITIRARLRVQSRDDLSTTRDVAISVLDTRREQNFYDIYSIIF